MFSNNVSLIIQKGLNSNMPIRRFLDLIVQFIYGVLKWLNTHQFHYILFVELHIVWEINLNVDILIDILFSILNVSF